MSGSVIVSTAGGLLRLRFKYLQRLGEKVFVAEIPRLQGDCNIMLSCSGKAPGDTWSDFGSDIKSRYVQRFGHGPRRLATGDDKAPEAKVASLDSTGGKRRLDQRASPFNPELVLRARTSFGAAVA